MSGETNTDKGIVDAANRIVAEFLKKPVMKQNLKNLLKNIDPESAPELARTVLWQEPELIMMLLAAVPSIANVVIKFMDEVVVQLSEKYPPELFKGYLRGVLDDIDREALDRLTGNFQKFSEVYLAPVIAEKFPEQSDDVEKKMLQGAGNE